MGQAGGEGYCSASSLWGLCSIIINRVVLAQVLAKSPFEWCRPHCLVAVTNQITLQSVT